jgi:cobalamin biosynthesis protein CobD/CbiB
MDDMNNPEKSESTDEKIVRLLDKIVCEQVRTKDGLDRIRGHLVFYTVLAILGLIAWFISIIAAFSS